MFRAMITPSSGVLDCVYSLWYNAPMMLPAGSLKAERFSPSAFRLSAGSIVGALYHKL
jgi:hypothetical protein